MIRLKCFKCGIEEGTLQKLSRNRRGRARIIVHHISYNPEVVVNCCYSCHVKIHKQIRKDNRCPFSVEIIDRLSRLSSMKRSNKHYKGIHFYDTVCKNVRLHEILRYNLHTGNIYYSAGFRSDHGHILLEKTI